MVYAIIVVVHPSFHFISRENVGVVSGTTKDVAEYHAENVIERILSQYPNYSRFDFEIDYFNGKIDPEGSLDPNFSGSEDFFLTISQS